MNFEFREHLAVFGGSFNPPHLGHLDAVDGILKNPGVKKVIIMPSYGNPLKPNITSFDERFEMAKLNFLGFEVSTFERDHQSASTFELLSKIQALAGEDRVAFAIGTDQFETFESWVNFPAVLSLSDWIVLLRKPQRLNDCGPTLQKFLSANILRPTRDPYRFEIGLGPSKRLLQFVETDAPDTSSTLIREKFALGKIQDIKKYLKSDVLNYIERKSLYGT